MIRILGLDPGKTTGVALVSFTPDHALQAAYDQTTDRDGLLNLVTTYLRGLLVNAVAIEKFVVNRRAGRSSSAQDGEAARDIIGAVRALCDQHGVRYIQRPAGVVKPWATDRRLSAAGITQQTKGQGHARDAARHALYAAVRDFHVRDPLSRKD